MIQSFNRRQRIRAVLSVLIGIVAYLLAFGFFYFVAYRAASMLPPGLPWWFECAVSSSILVIITASGWIRHRRNEEADLSDAVMWKGDVEMPGAFIAQDRINQVSVVRLDAEPALSRRSASDPASRRPMAVVLAGQDGSRAADARSCCGN